MQPYIFPYLGYFQLVYASDKFVFLDDVNFIKQGWINRNNILINNSPGLFTIPLNNSSSNKLILETQISNRSNWRNDFEKKIALAYKKAPFFQSAKELILSIIHHPTGIIGELAKQSIIAVSDYLNIKTEFVSSSTVYDNKELKGQERIIDICVKEHAVNYLNPIGGLALYNKEVFKEKSIDLFFIKSLSKSYNQFSREFIPNLSIIDVLMFNDPEEINGYLKQYELV